MAKQVSGIYCIIGPTGVYIGSSANVHKRWIEHKRTLNIGKHHNIRLQRAWNKHGADVFTHYVIEIIPIENLIEAEQRWLDMLFSGIKRTNIYNISDSSRGARGIKRTPGQIKALAEHNRGKKHSDEHKEKIRRSLLGNKRSLGYKYDTEERDRSAIGHSGGVKYTFISPEGIIHSDIVNVRRFCEEYNIKSRKTLIMTAKGIYKQCKGWKGFIQHA